MFNQELIREVINLRGNINNLLTLKAIQYAFEESWINEWEKDFYLRVSEWNNLSTKQINKIIQINNKFLDHCSTF